jgi:hypothetical protein
MFFVIAIIFGLIAINFLLLKFSSNKTIQRKNVKKPFIVQKEPTVITTQQISNQLAPTGS